MSENEIVDVLRMLIVGSRGRERADRLVCIDASGLQTPVEIKPTVRPARYASLVASLQPVRIEAYAGRTIVDQWGEQRAPAPAADEPRVKKKKKPKREAAAPVAPPLAIPPARGWRAGVMALSQHFGSLLAKSYEAHAANLVAAFKSNAEERRQVFQAIVDVAQHHADRAGHAEARVAILEKATRIRDRQSVELQGQLVRSQLAAAAAANEGEGDERTTAFLKLLQTVQQTAAAPTPAKTNGAHVTKKKTEAAAS